MGNFRYQLDSYYLNIIILQVIFKGLLFGFKNVFHFFDEELTVLIREKKAYRS